MAAIEIRSMRPGDIRSIMEIEQSSFTAPWSEFSFLNEIDHANSLARVALLENNLVGYICTRYIIDEGHIMNLAVHKDFRRQGIATELMNRVTGELKEKSCHLLYLEVRVSNIEAIKFYERFGFKVASFRRKYYSSPNEDAALMMRWL